MKCLEWLFWSCSTPSLKLLLPFLLTPWLHYLLISSLQKCSARSEKPLKSSAVSSLSESLFSPAPSPLFFFFFLVSLSSSSPSPACVSTHSVNHACPSRPSLPVLNKLFCSQGKRAEGRKGGEVRRRAWRCILGKSKAHYLQLELCCRILPDMNAEVRGGDKDWGRRDNWSIVFQLRVKLSNDLLLKPKWGATATLPCLDLNWFLNFLFDLFNLKTVNFVFPCMNFYKK